MTRMSKLPATVLACEPALVVVNQHVVVQAVLTCECGITDQAHKWLET